MSSSTLDSVKKFFSRYIDLSPSTFRFDTDVMWNDIKAWGVGVLRAIAGALLKVWLFIRAIVVKIDQTPTLLKLQVGLLTIILFFIFWQLLAYEFSQTTFITINIIMAVGLTSATAIISVRSQRGLDEAKRLNIELANDLEQRNAELDRLKDDLFELRNKNRRQGFVEKGSARFVDTVKRLKGKAKPGDGHLQYLVDAMGVCFEITGAVAFIRRNNEDAAAITASDVTSEGYDSEPETAEVQDRGVFDMSGSFGLSDDPPMTLFVAGDGILGQVVTSNKSLTLEKVPADYLTALSGLGRSRNINVYALPLTRTGEDRVIGVIEVASFEKLKIVDAWSSVEQQLRDII